MSKQRIDVIVKETISYDNKLDVDANYKRMVEFGVDPQNIQAVHLGIASHNLFELAYAYKLAQQNKVTEFFSFEMLEGMADHVRRAIQEMSGDMLLYAPVATKKQFLSAIAYLIRRLDENTAEENFLRHSCNLTTDSKAWAFLKDQFIASYQHEDKVGRTPHRTQNRAAETFPAHMGTFYEGEFNNEPDRGQDKILRHLPPSARWWSACIRRTVSLMCWQESLR